MVFEPRMPKHFLMVPKEEEKDGHKNLPDPIGWLGRWLSIQKNEKACSTIFKYFWYRSISLLGNQVGNQ
jgi:hypothetical protein